MAAPPNPRVGVAAIVKNRAGQFLVGRRKGAHGAGKWQFPGGHLEFGESPLACAQRETHEETGLAVTPLGLLSVTNDVFAADNKHYITLGVLCLRDDDSQEPEVRTPQRASRCVGERPCARADRTRTASRTSARAGTGRTGRLSRTAPARAPTPRTASSCPLST